MNVHDPIISFLLDEKVVAAEDLQPLLAKQQQTGASLLGLLQQEKLVNEEQIAKASRRRQPVRLRESVA